MTHLQIVHAIEPMTNLTLYNQPLVVGKPERGDFKVCHFTVRTVRDKIFGSSDFFNLKRGVRGVLHASDVRIFVDDHWDAVLGDVPIGSVFRPSGINTGAAILPARPHDAGVRSTGDGVLEERVG